MILQAVYDTIRLNRKPDSVLSYFKSEYKNDYLWAYNSYLETKKLPKEPRA